MNRYYLPMEPNNRVRHWVKLRFHRHGSLIIQFKAGLPYKVVDSTNIHVRFAAASVLRATRPLADKLQF